MVPYPTQQRLMKGRVWFLRTLRRSRSCITHAKATAMDSKATHTHVAYKWTIRLAEPSNIKFRRIGSDASRPGSAAYMLSVAPEAVEDIVMPGSSLAVAVGDASADEVSQSGSFPEPLSCPEVLVLLLEGSAQLDLACSTSFCTVEVVGEGVCDVELEVLVAVSAAEGGAVKDLPSRVGVAPAAGTTFV